MCWWSVLDATKRADKCDNLGSSVGSHYRKHKESSKTWVFSAYCDVSTLHDSRRLHHDQCWKTWKNVVVSAKEYYKNQDLVFTSGPHLTLSHHPPQRRLQDVESMQQLNTLTQARQSTESQEEAYLTLRWLQRRLIPCSTFSWAEGDYWVWVWYRMGHRLGQSKEDPYLLLLESAAKVTTQRS
jgi:hypothetical protein